MVRRLLPVLVLVSACGRPADADPKALLETWRDAMLRTASVRMEVENQVEGRTGWKTSSTAVLHTATTGFLGTTVASDIAVRHESQYGPSSFHVVKLEQGDETYVEHDDLTLPAGKKFVRFDHGQQVLWMWQLDSQISISTKDLYPGSVFVDLDRDTLRLVEADGDRYVLTAGRGVESNPSTTGTVTITVWVDSDDRVTRAEQKSHDSSGNPSHKTTVLSDWGSAPAVERPSPDVVASLAEAKYAGR
jgi:hypothetical protein